MKSIEMKLGDSVITFTPKSVNIDGVDYYYSRMSGLKHSAEKQMYAFKYNGSYMYLPYDPKFAAPLSTIFKQVNELDKKRQFQQTVSYTAPLTEVLAQAQAQAQAQARARVLEAQRAAAAAAAPKPKPVPAPVKPAVQERPERFAQTEFAQTEFAQTQLARTQFAQTEPEPVFEEPEHFVEEPAVEREPVFEKPVAQESLEDIRAEVNAASGSDKKGRLKKSLIVFAIVIAVVALVTVGYMLVFGTSDNPIIGPNSSDQQYNDIDQLMEDLD